MPASHDALFSAHAVLAALRSSIRVLRWGMLALILTYLCSGIRVVQPIDVGVVVRLGRVLHQTHQPGLLFALPPLFDEIVMVPRKSIDEISLDDWSDVEGISPAR